MAGSTQRFVSGNICSESLKSPEIFNWQHYQFLLHVKANCYQYVAEMYYHVSLLHALSHA